MRRRYAERTSNEDSIHRITEHGICDEPSKGEFDLARRLSAAGIAVGKALFHGVAVVSTSCLGLKTRLVIRYGCHHTVANLC